MNALKIKRRFVWVVVLVMTLMMVFAGCSKNDEEEKELDPGILFEDVTTETEAPVLSEELSGETRQVMVYFTDENLMLAPEKRTVPKVEGVARQTIEEMIKGPEGDELKSILPEGTTLKDINIKDDGLAIVDFSREFTNFDNVKEAEAGIYSIVNALTEFDTVKEVQFWVEGEIVKDIAGVDVENPLTRNTSIIK